MVERRSYARWVLLASVILVLGVTLVATAREGFHVLIDDAYIYFRYARNFAEGCGITFTCGTPDVEGFTSPAYFLLLALGYLLESDLEVVATGLGLVGGALGLIAAAFVPWFMRSSDEAPSSKTSAAVLVLACAIVLSLDWRVLVHALAGMEVWLGWLIFAAMTISALYRDVPSLIALSIVAVLVRPEFAVFVPFAVLFFPAARKPRWIALIALSAVAMELTRYAIFDAWFPNTVMVKRGGTAAHASLGLSYVWLSIKEHPWVLLAPLSLLASEHRRALGVVLSGSALWMASQLMTGGDFYEASRLLMPVIPVLTALGVVGVYLASERALRRFGGRTAATWLVLALAAGFVVHVSLQERRNSLTRTWGHSRVMHWRATGTLLHERFPPGTRVATVAIGAIGYYSDQHVIDLIGLVDRAFADGASRASEQGEGFEVGHETYHTARILELDPQVIVLVQLRVGEDLAEEPVIVGTLAEWDLIRKLRADDYVVWMPELRSGLRGAWLVRETLARQLKLEGTQPLEAVEVRFSADG